jgi:hypothetical protein
LEDWRIGGLEDWRIGGLEDWRIGGFGDLAIWRFEDIIEVFLEFGIWNLESGINEPTYTNILPAPRRDCLSWPAEER